MMAIRLFLVVGTSPLAKSGKYFSGSLKRRSLADLSLSSAEALSIVEAMALGKPVISSYNPYSPVDIEKEHIGFVVNDEKSWIHAINYLHTHRKEAHEMGNRARLLAESKFNIKACARQLSCCLESL